MIIYCLCTILEVLIEYPKHDIWNHVFISFHSNKGLLYPDIFIALNGGVGYVPGNCLLAQSTGPETYKSEGSCVDYYKVQLYLATSKLSRKPVHRPRRLRRHQPSPLSASTFHLPTSTWEKQLLLARASVAGEIKKSERGLDHLKNHLQLY